MFPGAGCGVHVLRSLNIIEVQFQQSA